MKTVEMDQSSPKWHRFRKKHIGASEAPGVLKKDPYGVTPHKIWAIKTGLIKQPEIFAGMVEKGGAAEARVRARYELTNGMKAFPPVVAYHPVYTFISASFDCYNAELNKGAEIKFVGEKKFKDIKEKASKLLPVDKWQAIPENNWIQVQQQIFVASADEWDYLYSEGTTGEYYETITVKPDLEFQKMLLEKEVELWDQIKSKTEPTLDVKDDDIIKDKETIKLIRQRNKAAQKEAEWKEKREGLEGQIEKRLSHIKSVAVRLNTRIKRSEKTGRYSYTSTKRKPKDDKSSK